jgi:hypothetical protein
MSGLTVALLQANGLTEYIGTGEAPLMVGVEYTIGTSVTTPAAVLTLANAGVNVTGATVTIPLASSGTAILNAPFVSYTRPTFTTADTWSLVVTTTAGAGAITPRFVYIPISYPGVSDAQTTT